MKNNIQVQHGQIYTVYSQTYVVNIKKLHILVSYTYKHWYHCLQIEDANMFVDDMKHSKIKLAVHMAKAYKIGTSSIKKCLLLVIL